jgi:hypothetical protein
MAEDRAALLAEAYKRDILPPEQKAAYKEAMRRGIVAAKPEMGWGEYADSIVRQAVNGATFGFADEIAGSLNSLFNGKTAAESIAAERARDTEFGEQYPIVSTAGQIVGGVAGALAGAGLVGAGARGAQAASATPAVVNRGIAAVQNLPRLAQYTGSGAVAGGASGAGFADGDLGDRAAGAAEGALVGGALGAALSLAARGVGKVTSTVLSPITDKVGRGPARAIDRQVLQAFERDAITPSRVEARLRTLGPDATIADAAGENTLGLLNNLVNQPGPGRQMAQRILPRRQAGSGERIKASAERGLGGRGFYESLEDLNLQRRTDATPLYDEAFQGGSTAPLRAQFENAFSTAATAESKAVEAVRAAEQKLLLSKSKQSGTENVYVQNAALSGERAAQAELDAAQKALSAARNDKQAVLTKLRQAQSDEASNAPGAVWSPRIQQFLDDPITKAGLAKGVEVQRLEALAAGRSFNPKELAITGLDDAGQPIVAGVPNLRTLDAVKRGLDEILEGYRDTTTGRLNLDQRGRAIDQVRRSLVKELDDLTGGEQGAYARARAAWAGPSSLIDAMAKGRNFARPDAEITDKLVAAMSDSEKEAFLIGVRRAVDDTVDRTGRTADATRKLLGTNKMTSALRAAFPDTRTYREFVSDLLRESRFNRTNNAAFGNSQTSYRQALRQDGSIDPAPISEIAQGIGDASPLRVAKGGVSLLRNVFGASKTLPEAQQKELAQLLLSRDRGDQAEALRRLTQGTQLLPIPLSVRRDVTNAAIGGLAPLYPSVSSR